jgi:rod shape determining protein RodA
MFVGGLDRRIIIGILAVVIPLGIIFISIVLQPDQKLLKDYQQTRILAWLHPDDYVNAEGYQQDNSKTAIGSGQLWGKGLDNNEISSVKNGNFISEPQTDFIFAIIGEELGFVGGCVVIGLIILIALECLLIARKAKDMAGTIICVGMAALVGFQGFMNIAVATGLMPNTGIPLPFVSYGLTSLISLYIGMGFVLNVGLQCVRKYS